MSPAFDRRRFLGVAAAAAGLSLLPGGVRAERVPLQVWRGVALGADAMLQIAHPDPKEAERLIALCLAEIARLEQVFSLYRPDSALVALNRDGSLENPPADLVRLLSEATGFSRLTGGAFDATVQPLWQLYAGHFSRPDADPDGPPAAAVAGTRRLVDHRAVRIEPDRIALVRRGMAVTLNGIAQGYVTDRVAERLKAEGLERVLVDLGEIRALGSHPAGRPWQVALRDPVDGTRPEVTIPLADRAVATSAGAGTRFDPAGRFSHLFDPGSGRCAAEWLSVSVIADDATTADALSTALSAMPETAVRRLVPTLPGLAVHFTRPDGSRLVLGS